MELENNNLKYTFLYSPRTNYNMKLETEQNLYIDLVKSFDPYSIKIIKKHFKEHLGILNKETFICILKNHLLSWNLNLPHRETMIIKLLSRLFDEIDINSTGDVQWSDFVNYIINLSNMNLNEKALYSLQSYIQSKTVINHQDNSENNKFKYMSSDSNIISYCFYIEKYKLLGIVHEDKSKIIFYNAEKRKIENIYIDLMDTQKEITEYEINELNTKAEKMIKKEEEEKERKYKLMEKLNNRIKYNINKEKERVPTPDSVKREIKKINYGNMDEIEKNLKDIKYYPIYSCFADEYDILFISSSNNKISAWKFDYKRNEFININNSGVKNNEFNFEENKLSIPLYSCEFPQYAMCFDNNLKVLYSGQEDGKIFQWDLSNPKPVHTFEILEEKDKYIFDSINTSNSKAKRKIIDILSLSKAERSILNKEKKEKKKNTEEKEDKKEKEKEKAKDNNFINNKDHKKKSVSCLLLINNLRLLCSSYYTGQIILWDTITKKPKKIYNDQKTIVYQVIYNPIKNRIYTCGFEHEIFVYDPYNEENAVEKIKGHMSSISSLSFNEENNEIVSIDIQGIMKIWDANNNLNFQTINTKESLNLEVNNNEKQKKKKNNKLNSNFYVEALCNVKQIIAYEENNLILFEKGKTLNPSLCDDSLIIGCAYNPYKKELLTISTERIKTWNIFNGKVNKIYENLLNGAEISMFELDKKNKKCYLGDNHGKIICYNLINGILLKEFRPHNSGIIKIIHSLKYNKLITGSSDLCIRFHSDIDDNKSDIFKEIYVLNNSSEISQEKYKLKNILFNEDDNMLIIGLSNGWVSFYDFNSNKFINDNTIEKNELGLIRRSSSLSSMTDLPKAKCLFISYENGERYILPKINNKYYHFLSGEKFGTFIEEDNIIDNKKRKNIIYSSVYDEASNRLIIGDHIGFIYCYNLNILNEIFEKNYNSKEEIINNIKKKLIIPYIFKIQPYKNSITNLFIPENLFPKIFISIGSDSVVNLFEFETGDYIESLKQISIKYTSAPVAISFIKENPFGEKENNIKEDEENYDYSDEESKKRKEKILQTIQKINKSHKHYLASNDQISINNKNLMSNNNDNDYEAKETIIYRCEIEPNLKIPQLNYGKSKRNDIIKYSNDILEYNAKMKLQSQVMGQNIMPDKSSPWNYNVDYEYIIRKDKEEFRKLYTKIRDKEKDVKNSENNFQHLSIISNNYKPAYLNKLKNKKKMQFSDFIKEKLRIINLSNNKRSIMLTEEKEIIKYVEKHKYPHNLKPLHQSKSNREENILTKKNNKKIEKRNETLDNNNNNKNNKNTINLDLKSFNTIDSNNMNNMKKNRRILGNKSSNVMIPLTEKFNDLRFLECKNQFEEKLNEISNPLKLIIKRYPRIIKLPKISQNLFGNNS